MEKLQLRPVGNRIIVEEDKFKYEGLIEIPDKARRRPTTGVIIAKGNDIGDEFKIGDHVLYAQFSGTGIQLKNQPAYRVLTEEEILTFIEPTAELEEISA